MKNAKCKICRRLGVKLFLKAEKCTSLKCPMLKKPYSPGAKGKRRPKPLSEYGKGLKEKQKLRNWYNLSERQFRRYVKEILSQRRKIEDAGTLLIRKLETRFDNIIFRLGFSESHSKARQLISHSHFFINGRSVNLPSYQLKKGDKISIKPASSKKTVFQGLQTILKKRNPCSWLELDIKKLEGKIIGEPTIEEAAPPAEISAIFEYYSR